jgi:uncharacterized protein (TIGR03435 family)
MMFPLSVNATCAPALMRHLWQSTTACAVSWLLSPLLRRNASRTRFRLRMLASLRLGTLRVRNAILEDVALGFQSAAFDRPVADRTSIDERCWDFTLKWTPYETLLSIIRSDEPADAPPPVLTSIEKQIGLKLDAMNTMVEMMVPDNMESRARTS